MRHTTILLFILLEAFAAFLHGSRLVQDFRVVLLPQLDFDFATPRWNRCAPNILNLLIRNHLGGDDRHVVRLDALAHIRTIQIIANDGHRLVAHNLLTQRGDRQQDDASRHVHDKVSHAAQFFINSLLKRMKLLLSSLWIKIRIN